MELFLYVCRMCGSVKFDKIIEDTVLRSYCSGCKQEALYNRVNLRVKGTSIENCNEVMTRVGSVSGEVECYEDE